MSLILIVLTNVTDYLSDGDLALVGGESNVDGKGDDSQYGEGKYFCKRQLLRLGIVQLQMTRNRRRWSPRKLPFASMRFPLRGEMTSSLH